jgi:hypothetical protein
MKPIHKAMGIGAGWAGMVFFVVDWLSAIYVYFCHVHAAWKPFEFNPITRLWWEMMP